MKTLSGRSKKCPECKTSFVPVRTLQKVCSPRCAISWGVKLKEKKRKKAEQQERKLQKEKRAQARQAKENNRTRGDLLKKAQDAVNAYIRVRDHSKPCISCGKENPPMVFGGVWDAGHYRSVGSAEHTRFVLTNIHKQCKFCNNSRGLSGNPVEYRKAMVSRYGEDYVLAALWALL